MDEIMDPFAEELMADTVTLGLLGHVSGGGALQDHMDLDTYLQAVGALPAAAAPAVKVEEPGPHDGVGVRLDYCMTPAVHAPARLPLPPGFPALPSRPCAEPGVLDGYHMQRTVHAPACLAPPPGFPPLPARAHAYAVRPLIPLRPARAAPVTNDSAAASNLALSAPYDDDIGANLRKKEREADERPSPDYLESVHGNKITASMRADLVVWMDRFIRVYDLAAGTLHRAVSYVDRFLSVRDLESYTYVDYNLRLLAAAAVYTAAKYESQSTSMKLDATKIARYGEFTEGKEAIIVMERTMMEALGYRLGGPTAETFVEHYTRYSQGEQELQVKRAALRFADQSLLNYDCLAYLPSEVAAAAIFRARLELNPPGAAAEPWSAELQELTGCSSIYTACCYWTMLNVE